MARTLVMGLTESGTRTTINEDTFSLGDRVYPDMITGAEERSGGSSAYTQLYIVTQGLGGSGVGDLAGRIVQRASLDLLEQLASYKQPKLNFRAFANDLIREAHERIGRQIALRNELNAGASFALFLIDANNAYVLNVGHTNIRLFRDNELFALSGTSGSKDPQDRVLIGDRTATSPPLPNTIKHFELCPGDIILLSTQGFNCGYHDSRLTEDLASPDAFAAIIRQMQIRSRESDNTENGTVLAIKVRDLELVEPSEHSPRSEELRRIYHDGIDERDVPAQIVETRTDDARRETEEETMESYGTKGKRKSNGKVFFLSLLLGFLIGIVIILLIWFIILQ